MNIRKIDTFNGKTVNIYFGRSSAGVPVTLKLKKPFNDVIRYDYLQQSLTGYRFAVAVEVGAGLDIHEFETLNEARDFLHSA